MAAARVRSYWIATVLVLSSALLTSCGGKKREGKEVESRKTELVDGRPTVCVIGAGPAGTVASVYLARGGVNAVMFTGMKPGGAIIESARVENWPGEVSISGKDLGRKLMRHAEAAGAIVVADEAESITRRDDGRFSVRGAITGKEFIAEAVIVATGGTPRRLGIPDEEKFIGNGISFCATCDGPFFKDKTVAVVGGGNTALVDAEELSRYASKVYMIIRSEKFRSTDAIVERILKNPKIEVIKRTVVYSIVPNPAGGISGVMLRDRYTGKDERKLEIDGLFVAIGTIPNSSLLRGLVEMDKRGYPIVDEDFRTSIPGIYAVGDLVRDHYKQLVVAASDGAIAAMHILEDYIPSFSHSKTN